MVCRDLLRYEHRKHNVELINYIYRRCDIERYAAVHCTPLPVYQTGCDMYDLLFIVLLPLSSLFGLSTYTCTNINDPKCRQGPGQSRMIKANSSAVNLCPVGVRRSLLPWMLFGVVALLVYVQP